jgi:hypothetical protein
MRTSLFFLFLLLLGMHSAAQEIVGSNTIIPGTLASFEVVPAHEASWHIVPPSLETGTHQVDSGLSKLYFSSPEHGRFTIIAGIVVEGAPRLLIKTFINGADAEVSVLVPPISSMESWVRSQIPVLVKSGNLAAEVRLVAGRFEEIVRRIDEGNIQTASNAQAQIHIALTALLAQTSPTAITDWTPFLTELSRRLESELGEKINDLTEVTKVLRDIGNSMKALELPDGNSVHLRTAVRPDNRGTQNRVFRNILAP